MRGVAVILAASSAWVLVTSRTPTFRVRVTVSLRSLAIGVVVSLGTAFVMYGFLGTVVPAVALGVLTASVPVAIEHGRAKAAMRAQMELWPDALAHMRASISAGLTLPDALIDACRRVGGPLGLFADEIRAEVAFGGGFAPALEGMRRALDDPVSDRVLATLVVANRVGGHRVGDVLSSLQESVADDLRLRRAHDAALTEQRWTAGVALVAPWALLVLSIATNPQASYAFDTPEGAAVVGIGFVATVSGWLLARRSARLSEPPRLFR
ncbi:MAG: type II secretion system F family protein [Actinomycetota bacterium]